MDVTTAIQLIQVPAGPVSIRDARMDRRRDVQLESFAIGATAVTVGEFYELAESPPPVESNTAAPASGVTWFAAIAWCNAASAREGLDPAYAVDGDRVRWDVASPGYRLPTEAEWERACRAGTTGPRYGELADIAWTAADARPGPHAVGGKAPNEWGLFDTLGNVWEWCWDYANTARYGAYRSMRGGGWDDPEWSVRASVRRGSAPDAVIEDVGFRVARGAMHAGESVVQGWSATEDRERALDAMRAPLPMGWTPLLE